MYLKLLISTSKSYYRRSTRIVTMLFRPSSGEIYCISVCSTRSTISLLVSLIHRYVLDESVTAYIILRTRNQDEDRLKSYLSRIAISLEVQAHGLQSRPSSSQNASTESSPSRTEDTLWSGDVDTSRQPIIIWPQGEERHSADYILAIWKHTFALCKLP